MLKQHLCLSLRFMESSEAYLFSFFLDSRAFSAGVSRRTWFTHVTEIKTVLSIKLPEIAASTADYKSALKWECPKNVSCLRNNLLFVISYICGSPKGKNYYAVMWLKPVFVFTWRERSMYLVHNFNFRPLFTDFWVLSSAAWKLCVLTAWTLSKRWNEPFSNLQRQMLFYKPAKPVNLTMQSTPKPQRIFPLPSFLQISGLPFKLTF